MLSAKVFNLQTNTYTKFHSDFPITSMFHIRVLKSNDNENYVEIDPSDFYTTNDDIFFFGDIPEVNYIKILVATNPDELFTAEVEDILNDLEELVDESEILSNTVEQNMLILEQINLNIENIRNNIVNMTNNIANNIDVSNEQLSISNTLVNKSDANIITLNDLISIIEAYKVNAEQVLLDYQNALGGYDDIVIEIDAKLVELEAYKVSIEENATITSQAAIDAKEASNLAKQYRDESIQVVNDANLNISEIEQMAIDAQQLEASAAASASTATQSITDCANYESSASGYVSSTEASAANAEISKQGAVDARIAAELAAKEASDLASGNIIDDNNPSTNMVYSSAKIEEMANTVNESIINDSEVSDTSTYSSGKIERDFVNYKFDNLNGYASISKDDFLHLYSSINGLYYKALVDDFSNIFENPTYDFKNLAVTDITPSPTDYYNIYDSLTGEYKKISADKVLSYSQSSILYNFNNITTLGKDAFGNYIYRKSSDYTHSGPLDNNLSISGTYGYIINMECIVRNTTTNDTKVINLEAVHTGGGTFTLNTYLVNDKDYNEIVIIVDFTTT